MTPITDGRAAQPISARPISSSTPVANMGLAHLNRDLLNMYLRARPLYYTSLSPEPSSSMAGLRYCCCAGCAPFSRLNIG